MADIDVEITSGHIVVVDMNRGYSGYSGKSGYSGYSGANPGASGYSGYSGKSGYSGISGKSGYSGASGYSGYSGRSAYSGYSGVSGYSGYSGLSGFSGYSGPSGFSGYSGISGFSGFSGMSGFSGAVGLTSYLNTTVTYNNTAALADTALSVTAVSNIKYGISLVVHSTSAVRSLNMDFAGTASITNFIGEWQAHQADDLSNFSSARVTAAGTDFSGGTLDAANGFYTFNGSVEVNSGGTFLLRGAQRVADVSNTTILAGSTLVLTRMS